MRKVIVIGAGMGGMAAAARLARAGMSVELFEASDRVGGKCRTDWIGDYAFDTGPSLLTLPAVYRDLFKKTGKRLEIVKELQPVDPAFSYHFADGTQLTFPNLSLPKICAEIDEVLGKKAGDDWHALMQRAERMWDVARGPFIESELPTIHQLLRRKGFLKDLKKISPHATLEKFTSQITSDPYLTKIIHRYATYTGSDPRRVPAVLLTIAFVEISFGAWHITGGIGTLAEALGERCQELGVDIHLNSPVEEIVTEGGTAVGVRVNGVLRRADYIISNADSEITFNRLISQSVKAAKKERQKLAKREKSFSGFSLLIGLDNSKVSGQLPKLTHHNVYFPEDYQREFDQLFYDKTPVTDPTIYICAPQDPSMVKGEDKEAWFVLVNAPLHEPGHGHDWSQKPEIYAQSIIKRLDQLGLRVTERLDVLEIRSPQDLENSVAAPGGAIYGRSSNGMRAAFLRTKNKSSVKNLYSVGGSAHPGGGLPLVGISGELVAESIIAAQGGVGIPKDHH
jgi:phytoene desaturase